MDLIELSPNEKISGGEFTQTIFDTVYGYLV